MSFVWKVIIRVLQSFTTSESLTATISVSRKDDFESILAAITNANPEISVVQEDAEKRTAVISSTTNDLVKLAVYLSQEVLGSLQEVQGDMATRQQFAEDLDHSSRVITSAQSEAA